MADPRRLFARASVLSDPATGRMSDDVYVMARLQALSMLVATGNDAVAGVHRRRLHLETADLLLSHYTPLVECERPAACEASTSLTLDGVADRVPRLTFRNPTQRMYPGQVEDDGGAAGGTPFQTAKSKLWQDERDRKNGRGGRGRGGNMRGGMRGSSRGGRDDYGGRGRGRGRADADDMRPAAYHFGDDPMAGGAGAAANSNGGAGGGRKVLGAKRKFQPPARKGDADAAGGKAPRKGTGEEKDKEDVPEQLRNLDEALIEKIENEIMDHSDPVSFDDIAGLAHAKQSVVEIVVWPMKRPDLFTGLRSLPKGLLLFGPPGTGKTLIGKAIATQCGATFFSISASSLTSKWVGEGEKMVRCLFAVASVKQPAVIFIDEIDSLLQARSDNDVESSRRIKTEFLVQLDGAGTKSTDQVLVVGATNRPQELDEAARRRFVKRLYIPLPSAEARKQLCSRLLSSNTNTVTDPELDTIVELSKGFSGADVANLCKEAAMGPVRHGLSGITDITSVTVDSMPPITMKDFSDAFSHIRPSVAPKELLHYEEWNREFGSFPGMTVPLT